MQTRIIEPARHAAKLLASRPYLTRMLTRISPEEMTADPAFHLREDMDDVPRERWVERQLRCGKSPRYVMEDGRKVIDNTSFGWAGSLSDMPAASAIEMVGMTGAPLLVASFDVEIDATLEVANEQRDDGFEDYDPANDASAGCRVHSGIARHGWPFAAIALLWLRRRRLRSA
jgi:hypothetical protein